MSHFLEVGQICFTLESFSMFTNSLLIGINFHSLDVLGYQGVSIKSWFWTWVLFRWLNDTINYFTMYLCTMYHVSTWRSSIVTSQLFIFFAASQLLFFHFPPPWYRDSVAFPHSWLDEAAAEPETALKLSIRLQLTNSLIALRTFLLSLCCVCTAAHMTLEQ